MGTATYGQVSNESQRVMYSVLKADSDVLSYVKTYKRTNIYDGDPLKVAMKYGVPFIIVSPPQRSISPASQLDWEETVTIPLTMRAGQEKVLRGMYDAVVKAITNAEYTFEENNLTDMMFGMAVTDDDIVEIGNNIKNIYGLSFDVFFQTYTNRYRQ